MADTALPKARTNLAAALPFWISLILFGSVILGAVLGGWWLVLPIVFGWYVTSVMDYLLGLNTHNVNPEAEDTDLFWYRAITIAWFPLQFLLIYGSLIHAIHFSDFTVLQQIALFIGVGVASGSIGINYAHELMHQKPKIERVMADLLMCSVLYGHFRSEHLLVHHRYIGTPRDPVTARYNEGFHRFLLRVLPSCLRSAWGAERDMLARKKLPVWHRSNPFWKYGALQLGFLLLAFVIGGWVGVGLYFVQAWIAVTSLELVNYVEHYGLTREHLGEGKYEHVKPRHSWNAAHRVTNYLLVNLQRHSDHHYKPNRRFPLLQTYSEEDAPQLPQGYPLMTLLALVPPLWRKRMNPRVREWRKRYYPHITDWSLYNQAANPRPK